MIFALRWASDMSLFNVSLIVQEQSHETSVHKITIFEENGEPKREIEPGVIPLTSRAPYNHQA